MTGVEPERFLTYNADVRHMADIGRSEGQQVGEVFLGHDEEPWEAVTADYDPETGKTRVGFAPLAVVNRQRRIDNEKEHTDV